MTGSGRIALQEPGRPWPVRSFCQDRATCGPIGPLGMCAKTEVFQAVQSRHLVARVEDDLIGFGSPDFADVLVVREAAERLETTCEVVCVEEVSEVAAHLFFGSGCIDFRGARDSRLEKRSGDMSDLVWLSDAQMARLEPFFPKSHGKPRVDDRRVLSGIIFIDRNGLRWRDAPAAYGPHKTLYSRWRRWSDKGVFARLMAGLAAEHGEQKTVMIDATYLKAHRTATSMAAKKGGAVA